MPPRAREFNPLHVQYAPPVDAPVDPRELAARVFRPARPRFAEALSVVTALPPAEALAAWERTIELRAQNKRIDDVWVRRPRGLRDPAEAWELLAARGVIPRAWVERDPGRRRARCECLVCAIHTRPSVRARCPACRGVGGAVSDGAAPPTVRGCLTLASDPDGVERAEALARELSVRLGARCAGDPAITWWVIAAPWTFPGDHTAGGPLSRARQGTNERHAASYHLDPVGEHPRYIAPMKALRAVCDAGGSYQAASDVFGQVAWEGPGPNPYDALVAVWLTGYAVADVTDDGVTLVALSV